MSIVKMKRLRLSAMAEDREKLLQELLVLGCVELTETEQLLQDPQWADIAHRDGNELPKFKSQYAKVSGGLETLLKYNDTKKPLLSPLPELELSQFFSEENTAKAIKTAGEIEADESRITRLYGELNKLSAAKAALLPWSDTDIPLDTTGTKKTALYFMTAPGAWELEDMRRDLAAATELAELTEVSSDREQHYLILVLHRDEEEAALGALRPYGVSRLSFREYSGTAAENVKSIEKSCGEHEAEIEKLVEKIKARAGERAALEQAVDKLTQDISREEAREKLLLTKKTVTLEGWMPAAAEPELKKLLSGYCSAYELEDPAPEEYGDVPVKLKNNKLTRCLNMVTEMYSLPVYGSVDPNPLMAPFFILFYGIMMADMGYGLLMMLAGIVVLSRAKPREGMRNFFELMFYCGISTFAFGFMTGGFFGDLIPQIVKTVSPGSSFAWPWPILFTPLDDTITILLGSLVLGFIQIITGMIIGFIRKTKKGEFLDALLDEGAWWVIFAGIGLAVTGKGNISGVPVVLVVGLLMMAVGAGRHKKGFGKITAVFGALYNGVTGFFGDILSYSRLMALMLAGSVIAQVFNTIGAIPGNIIVLIIVSMVGNALNFGLNLLGCFVHDLRLQCLEYFGKFYEDGGRAFKPLSINTKYVNTTVEK